MGTGPYPTSEASSFPIGTAADVSGPDMDTIGSAIAADAEQFEIVFNAGGQVVNDTITLVALAVAQPTPEPASLTLLGSALCGLVWLRRRRTH